MLRRRKKTKGQQADLDVTPFMNLMIVLVPVLLLSMVFTHTTVIELELPNGDTGTVNAEHLQLEVVVRSSGLVVQDAKGGTIRELPFADGTADLNALREVLRGVKQQAPDKRDLTLLLADDVSYQLLVQVMDTVRSYPAVVVTDVVQAELFPVIALGDAPVLLATEGGAS